MSSAAYAGLWALGCIAIVSAPQSAAAQPAQALPLTRADALQRALGNDPRIGAAEASNDAAEAGLRQAGRAPNPTLGIVAENVEGSGPYRSWERAETTYSLSQRLELGGDRGARRRIAQLDVDASRLSLDVARLDLIEEVEYAFIDAQAAQAVALVAQDRLGIARELTDAVRRRVAAARDPLMAGARAEARLSEAEIEAAAAERAAIAARLRLQSYWDSAEDVALDMSSFERMAAAPASGDQSGLRGLTSDTPATTNVAPDLALANLGRARAEAEIRAERARAIPDPDLQVGWRSFAENDETALVVGFSVPLALWDRNSDAVARARAESARAGYDYAARSRALARERATIDAQLVTSRLEVEALEASVIPRSQEALTRAREGYAQGAFSYLDVLEAQRALSDARLRRISALRSYHQAGAAMARLTGARAQEFPQ